MLTANGEKEARPSVIVNGTSRPKNKNKNKNIVQLESPPLTMSVRVVGEVRKMHTLRKQFDFQ